MLFLCRPIRRYYKDEWKRRNKQDLESGQRDDNELTSIRVDRSHPAEHETASYYIPQQQGPAQAPYEAPGRTLPNRWFSGAEHKGRTSPFAVVKPPVLQAIIV